MLRVLRDVHDPELHRSIVNLGMVGDVEVREGRVLVAIRLTVAGCPLKAEIQRRVTEALAPLPGIETIQVTMDAMTDEERKRLRAGAHHRRGAPVALPAGQPHHRHRGRVREGRRRQVEHHRKPGPGPRGGRRDASACWTPTSTATPSPA